MKIDTLFPSKYFKADDFAQPRIMFIANVMQEEVGDDRELKAVSPAM